MEQGDQLGSYFNNPLENVISIKNIMHNSIFNETLKMGSTVFCLNEM